MRDKINQENRSVNAVHCQHRSFRKKNGILEDLNLLERLTASDLSVNLRNFTKLLSKTHKRLQNAERTNFHIWGVGAGCVRSFGV